MSSWTLQEHASWATSVAQSAVSAIHEEYKYTFEDHRCHLFQVQENIIAVDYPCRDRLHWLAAKLNSDFGTEYLVINLSGATYDTTKFQGPVMDIKMSRYVPPLDVLLRLCVSVRKWLTADSQRHLVVHGGATNESLRPVHTMGPVLVFLACYLSWSGDALHPKEALTDVCNILKISEKSSLPSQGRYLNYFELLQRGLLQTCNQPPIHLVRLVLVGIGGDGEARTLEISQQERVLFRSELDVSEAIGAVIPVAIPFFGDLVIQILRVLPETNFENSEVPELQVCFHTAFVHDGFKRFAAPEIDFLTVDMPSDVAIDIFFEHDSSGDSGEAQQMLVTASAVAAAAQGPAALCTVSVEPSSKPTSDDSNSSAQPAAVFDMTVSDSPKIVFKPDDIDAFFADL